MANQNISNLDVLEFLPNLILLDLSDNHILDISVLLNGEFPNLKELSMDGNHLTNSQIVELEKRGLITKENALYSRQAYVVEIQKENNQYILNTTNYAQHERKDREVCCSLEQLIERIKEHRTIMALSCEGIDCKEELKILDAIQDPEYLKCLEIKDSASEEIGNHISRYSRLKVLIVTAPIQNVDFLERMKNLQLLGLCNTAETSVQPEDILKYEYIENTVLLGLEEQTDRSLDDIFCFENVGKILGKRIARFY